VRRALAAGDVPAAVAAINDIDPSILDDNPALAFALARQRLIELARAGDADAALAYAADQLAPRGDDDPALLADLESALSLLAFADPASSPVGHLLAPEERARAAGDANVAILAAGGRDGEARLAALVKLCAWAQGRLAARGVRFPRMADPATGALEGP
jgi:hypothetical protein